METLAIAKSFSDQWDELEFNIDEPTYKVKQAWIDSAPVILTKMYAPTLTTEHLVQIMAEPPAVMTAINSNMTAVRLPDQDGLMTFAYTIKTPPLTSDRNMFVTYYIKRDEATGAVTLLSTSTGNDAFETSEEELIGSNVVGHLVMSYVHFEPSSEGGFNIE